MLSKWALTFAAISSCLSACSNSGAGQQAADGEPSARTRQSSANVVPSGRSFTCTPTRVWDGDGPIWCAEGPRIRLAGIAAREIDESCRPGQPCPTQSGHAARDHLVTLLGGARGTADTGHIIVQGPLLMCESEGGARGSRTAAWCRRPDGVDLSCAMQQGGYAARWERYDPGNRCR